MRIADFDPENKPRERFIAHGPAALSSAELLAIVLRVGTREHNILDTCNELLSLHGLEALAELTLEELQETSGIGPSKAMQIKAIFELNKRLHYKRNTNRKIQGARDVFEYMKGRVSDETKEHLFVLHLNTKIR